MIKVGNWSVHATELKLVWQDQVHYLEPRAMDLLVFLIKHPGEVIPRDTLVDHVWKGMVVSDHAVTSCIAKVRKILHLDSSMGPYIDTISKRGYRLHPDIPVEQQIEPVKQPFAASQQLSVDSAPEIVAEPVITEPELPELMLPQRRYQLLIGLFALLCLPVVWLAHQWWQPGNSLSAQFGELKPLTSRSGQETAPYLSADGQTYAYLQQTEQGWSLLVNRTGVSNALLEIPNIAAGTPAVLSDDGNYLLYARQQNGQCSFIQAGPLQEQPATTAEKTIGPCPDNAAELDYDWNSARTDIFYTMKTSENGPYAISRLNILTSKVSQLTTPQNSGFGDYRLRLAPDGESLYFLRNHYWRKETEFMRLNLQTDQLEAVSKHNSLINAFDVDAQGRLIFVVKSRQVVRLTPGSLELQELYNSPIPISHPSISADQRQLAFTMMQSRNYDIMVHQMTDMAVQEEFAQINSSRTEMMPAFAHQKPWLAFFSDRSGKNQLYIVDFKGKIVSSTHVEDKNLTTGMLLWTHDDSAVFFYSENILYRLDVRSNQLSQQQMTLPYVVLTGVSADGVSVYFASDHQQDWQIYRFRQGKIEQVTEQGGIVATEDQDGRYLYLTRYHKAGIWRKDLQSGEEQQLIDDAVVRNSNQLHLAKDKLYYLSGSGAKWGLWAYSLTTGEKTQVPGVQIVPDFGFSISSDEKLLGLTQPPAVIESDIMQINQLSPE